MIAKIAQVLAFLMLVSQLTPGIALSWHSPQPRYEHNRHYGYGGYDLGYPGGYGHRYPSYEHGWHDEGDDAVIWGLTGLLLGSLLVAATLPPAMPPQPEIYYSSPPLQTYSYPPPVPPGMCRWERYFLDTNGNYVLDQYGQPVKEYTLGSCQYPPN